MSVRNVRTSVFWRWDWKKTRGSEAVNTCSTPFASASVSRISSTIAGRTDSLIRTGTPLRSFERLRSRVNRRIILISWRRPTRSDTDGELRSMTSAISRYGRRASSVKSRSISKSVLYNIRILPLDDVIRTRFALIHKPVQQSHLLLLGLMPIVLTEHYDQFKGDN